MNTIKTKTNQLKLAVCKVTNIVWIIAIVTIGLLVLDIVQLPTMVIRAFGIGLLLTAAAKLYKSIK